MSQNKDVTLYPQPGLLVRDPRTMVPLSEKGEIRTLTGRNGAYWKRRIKDGSVKTVPFSEPKPRKRTAGGNEQ